MEKQYIQNVLWLHEGSYDATPDELKKKPRPYIKRDAHGRFKKYMNTIRISDMLIDFGIGFCISILVGLYFWARYV